MKLKGGSMVEVCRRNEGPFGSWYRARIISVDGQRYKVQYENILDVDRKSVVEEVYSEATRPVPPSMKGLGNWEAGDTIEVYDHHSWKIGKIVKVLPGNFFIVKLLESRRERTCHQSNLRPRLSWQDGKWLRAQQAARNHYVRLEASQERVSFAAFSQESHAGLQLQDLDVQIGAGNRKNGLPKTDSYLCKPLTSHVSLKATKRKPGIQMQSAYKEDFFNREAAPQKRRAIQKSRNHEAMGESSRPLLEKVPCFSLMAATNKELLALLEEVGGDPSGISFGTRYVDAVCAHVSQTHPTVSSLTLLELRLQCSSGQCISSIRSASLGNLSGSCRNFIKGSCHAVNSTSIVEKAYLFGRRHVPSLFPKICLESHVLTISSLWQLREYANIDPTPLLGKLLNKYVKE